MRNITRWVTLSAFVFGLALVVPGRLRAHCDGLDGPVVKAAQKALETRNVALVLIWVQAKDEPEIRAAFEKTLEVRRLSPQALELADHYFFETLVRVHRAGEGAPYTGLQPAGRDLGPAIPAADKALDTGMVGPVVTLLTKAMEEHIRQHFREAVEARNFKPNDVGAGRQYVQAYVEFIHYVERVYEAITTPVHGHYGETK
jgi:hypothetical protein